MCVCVRIRRARALGALPGGRRYSFSVGMSRNEGGRVWRGGRGYRDKKDRRREPPASPGCKVFVNNIGYQVTSQELSEFFSEEFGPVTSAYVVRDTKTRRSRGIGFVTFATSESAKLALEASEDQLILDGRSMEVQVPRPKQRYTEGKGHFHGNLLHDEEENVADKESTAESYLETEKGRCVLNDHVLFHLFSYLLLKDRIKIERVCRQWRRVALVWWRSAKVLSFSNVFTSFAGKYSALTDAILNGILSRGCLELQHLDVSGSPCQLTQKALQNIGARCEKLTYLNLSRVTITPIVFKYLTQRCTQLKKLVLQGYHTVGENSVWWALHQCRELELLDVSFSRRISGKCFYMSGPRLHTVKVSNCAMIGDAAVTQLVEKCGNLRVLDISKCGALTGRSLQALARVRKLLQNSIHV